RRAPPGSSCPAAAPWPTSRCRCSGAASGSPLRATRGQARPLAGSGRRGTGPPDGVVCALGDWFGGYALYVTEGQVHFAFARSYDAIELAGGGALRPGPHELTVLYAVGEGGAPGRMALVVDGTQVDATAVEGTLPLAVQHGGAGLRIGQDIGFPVS